MADDVKKAETPVEAKEEAAAEEAKPAVTPAPVEVIKQFQPEHPAMQAMQAIDGYLAKVIAQGVHPAQATTYVLSAALSLLRTLGFSGKDMNDLVIHFNQTWRLMTETENQKPN